jgi:hypothetical protein
MKWKLAEGRTALAARHTSGARAPSTYSDGGSSQRQALQLALRMAVAVGAAADKGPASSSWRSRCVVTRELCYQGLRHTSAQQRVHASLCRLWGILQLRCSTTMPPARGGSSHQSVLWLGPVVHRTVGPQPLGTPQVPPGPGNASNVAQRGLPCTVHNNICDCRYSATAGMRAVWARTQGCVFGGGGLSVVQVKLGEGGSRVGCD